jgi:hypothetical protein
MSEKVYIGTGKLLQGKNGYKDRLETAISPDDLRKLLAWSEKTGRWVRITWSERKEPSKNGATHYGVLNEWAPKSSSQEDRPVAPKQQAQQADESETMPF